jgi:hypothetical protein
MKKIRTCVEVSGKALEEWNAFCNLLTEADSMLTHGNVATPWHAYQLPKCRRFQEQNLAKYPGPVSSDFQIINEKLCIIIRSWPDDYN